MLKKLWRSIQNIMIAKSKYVIIVICFVVILALLYVNIYSVYIKGDVVGGSYLQENSEKVCFYCGCTVINTSLFPKKITVDVYSFRDAENSYIVNPELKVESIELLQTGEIIEGNQFVIAPLSSCSISIISTGEYGGHGTAERHPADTVKLIGEFIR